jgi:dipeptidyl aminopeptidase/acylaminoacyl peptidase
MLKLISFFIAILFSTAVCAQTNFIGTWDIKEKQMVTGPQYANALPKQIKVSQTADSLFIESTSIGNGGQDYISRQSFAMNGKESERTNTSSKRKYVSGLQWSPDKSTLIFTTVFYVPENENTVDFTRIETWTLAANGQLNIDKKSIETRSETWEIKGIFEKQ